jgi:hypothetical protein
MKENKKKPKGVESANFFGGPDPFFEEKKNEFLAAIYDQNPRQTESAYELILQGAQKKAGTLSETDEKYLRQIQVAFKQFKPFILTHGSEKMLAGYQALQSLIRKNVRDQSVQPEVVAYNTWKTRVDLASWQQDLVFTTAVTFQMTSGCSNYCRRCNEWALPKIRSHFSKGAVKTLIGKLMASGNMDLSLYGASDPLDWEDASTDLRDILSGLDAPEFSLLTKIPRGKEGLLKALLEMDINISVSLTDRNRSRIETIEEQRDQPISKQHASKDLLIPAGLDEDFISVKPSITDGYGTEITPEGAWIIIPTFTSALHPFGHKKLPVTRTTPFFPVKKLGRQALLVDYFKPLEVIGKDKTPVFLSRLQDVQVESILLDNGSEELTPPGMRSLKEFFSIFEETARRQRKKMTPAVIKRLKKKFLSQTRFSDLSDEKKQLYKAKILAHLAFCNKKVVDESRLCAASFFLEAITFFLKRHPVKGRIIAFLTEKETIDSEKYPPSSQGQGSVSLLSPPLADTWKIFRRCAVSLVHGCHDENITAFIANHPSKYDSMADRFVKGP